MHPFLESLNKTGDFVVLTPYQVLEDGPKLTAGVLMATDDCVSQPLVLQSSDAAIARTGECNLYALFNLGGRTTGHGSIVHGGLLATLLDESLCRCGFALLPHQVGVTASLNLSYRAPTPAPCTLLLHAKTDRAEGRKVWVSGRTYILEPDFAGDISELQETMHADLLAIEPKWYEKLLEGPAVKAEGRRKEASQKVEATTSATTDAPASC